MHNFINKIKREITPRDEQYERTGTSSSSAIQESEVYRYRKQRGVNLGSWFVLERWVCEEPFRFAKFPGQSDLDVALGDHAKETLERHWDTWIQEKDWQWISSRGINAVRIPIGYYHLCATDPSVLHGTEFQPHHKVYSGAWSRITRAIQIASSLHIGVLIDLHAAPGKQNSDSHAGTSDKANFFSDSHNQNHTVRVLCSLVTHLKRYINSCNPPLLNIIGIELLNEPSPPLDHVLQKWYTSAISEIRDIDASIPIYLGDCWRTDVYAEFIAQHPSPALTVLDHHLYRCFTSENIHTSAEDLSRAISDSSGSISSILMSASEKTGRAGGGVVIAEWSGALNPGSLRGVRDEQKNYIAAQLGLFERCCAGWFFWTYKKQDRGDTGWSFRDAVEQGVFPNFVGIQPRSRGDRDNTQRDQARGAVKNQALDSHRRYWSKYPGSYDHALFESGFISGWDDAYRFLTMSSAAAKTINELGFIGAWARRRATNHGKNYWEFEQGFMQAVNAATLDYNNR